MPGEDTYVCCAPEIEDYEEVEREELDENTIRDIPPRKGGRK